MWMCAQGCLVWICVRVPCVCEGALCVWEGALCGCV